MRKVALLSLITLLLSGCHHELRSGGVQGSGKRELQNRQIPSFTSISTEGAFTIEVTCQKEPRLEIEADDNILSLVRAEVSNNVLRLSNSGSYSTKEPVTIRISVPNLESLSIKGAGTIDIKGMKNEKFEIDSEGAPTVYVSGTTNLVDIHSDGAGKIDTNSLRAARAVVNSNGATHVELDVKEQLNVTVNGPSTVFYKGDPIVSKSVNGPGRVQRRGGEGA